MECKVCGKPIDGKDEFCPHCGAKNIQTAESTNQNDSDSFVSTLKSEEDTSTNKDSKGNYTGYNNGNTGNWNDGTKKKEDKGDTLANIASCCFPIVGIILFFIWREERPKAAKSVCMWAIIGAVLVVVIYIVLTIVGVMSVLLGEPTSPYYTP